MADINVLPTKALIGLGNVDNTSDASKPISTATQTALNAKAALGANSDITSLSGLTTALSIAQGGTGATTQSAALTALGAATAAQGALAAQLPTVATADSNATMVVNNAGTAIIAAQRRAQRVSLLDDRWCSAAMAADMLSWAPTLDHTSVFTAAISYCQSTHSTLFIPAVYARLSSQITMLSGFSVECDNHAVLRWVNTTGTWGWKCVGDTSTSFPGYGSINLPFLYGPSSYTYTGTSSTNVFDLTTFKGSALTIDGWVFGVFNVHRAEGWEAAVRLQGTNRTCGNNRITHGVIDLCYKGLVLEPVNSNGVYQSSFLGDNVFAYYPVYIATTNGPVFDWSIDAYGFVSTQSGGVCLYFKDVTMTGVQTCTDIKIQGKVFSGYSTTDSPNTTSSAYLGTVIGGNYTGPNSETGYANGQRNIFILGYNDRVPAIINNTTIFKMFKLTGSGSRIQCLAPIVVPTNASSTPTSNADASITLSQTAGLANFNSGAPCIHKLVRCVVTSPSDLASGAVADFYYYNELVNTTNNIGINISTILNVNGIGVYAIPNGTSEHGKVTIRIKNMTNATITAANTATNFWVEIPYA
ncbi:hypothetical protein [Allorhizobium ampelinum]|uniref:hypothetical protein n=1 Tax=Allorhizobium ampelinum TaxID=3025782 RepID=UPI000B3FFB3C|nr:hypothetical protein [Allorhizobium ampelinum]NTA27385.1 hypothetical protein [Allorhizobium ampelinum]OVE94440.1 hypothetical protein B7W85_12885 [Allorhizobium ampelinum]